MNGQKLAHECPTQPGVVRRLTGGSTMLRTMIVVWLALLVLALNIFTSVTRIIEKHRPKLSSHSAPKKLSAS